MWTTYRRAVMIQNPGTVVIKISCGSRRYRMNLYKQGCKLVAAPVSTLDT